MGPLLHRSGHLLGCGRSPRWESTISHPQLSVNVNKVALLRNARGYGVPSVLEAARTCIEAGSHGITIHPRPDERHITAADVDELAALLADHPDVEFNIEGNPFEGRFLQHVEATRPHQATLVPDAPGQSTSDHGWDVRRDGGRLVPIIERIRAQGTRVSLFVDPDPGQVGEVPATRADRVELYTEGYARAFREGSHESVLAGYARAATRATEVGLGLNAGHDLNRANLGAFREAIPNLLEVSIGHELIADALWLGLDGSVRAYLGALGHPAPSSC